MVSMTTRVIIRCLMLVLRYVVVLIGNAFVGI